MMSGGMTGMMKRLMVVSVAAFAAEAIVADDGLGSVRMTPILHHLSVPREAVDLGGMWEFTKIPNVKTTVTNAEGKVSQRLVDRPVAESLKLAKNWTPQEVPSVARLRAPDEDGYFRRKIEIRGEWLKRRIVLHFELAYRTFAVNVNGRDVGLYRRWGVPTDVDITKYVKEGENELVVCVRDDGSRWEDRNGPDWRPGWASGELGIRRPVHLEIMDRVYIRDVVTRCEVGATNVFHAEVIVANAGSTPCEAKVSASVAATWQADAQTVTVPAGGEAVIRFDRPWPNALLWTPDDPNLYFLDVTVEGRDAFRRRFGFCEVKVVRDRILFNGNPVMLRRGDECLAPSKGERIKKIAFNRRCGATGARLWIDYERACDVADEMGYFYTPVAHQSWGSAYKNQEVFWGNYAQYLREWVRALRHHPSILYWCASNEFGTIYGGKEGSDVEEEVTARQAKAQGVITEEDVGARRPWEACGEVELGYPVKGSHGPMPIRSFHYPIGYINDGCELPEAAYWYDKGSPMPWQGINVHDKPLSISEDIYHGFTDQHIGMSRFGGDKIYTEKGYVETLQEALDCVCAGLYAAGVTTWEPWLLQPQCEQNLMYFGRSVYPDFLVAMRDYTRNLRSGKGEDREIYVYNQTFRPVKANLQRVFRLNGEVVGSTNEWIQLSPGCKVTRIQRLQTPEVKEISDFDVEVTLSNEDGSRLVATPYYSTKWSFKVHPEAVDLGEIEKGALVAAADSPLAKRARWPKGVHSSVEAALDSGAKRIVVARGSITVGEGRALEHFVEKGGRVLLLEVGPQSWTPVELIFKRPVSVAFRRDEVALPGVDETMLRVWRGDAGLGDASYLKPAEDSRILVDCGHKEGLTSFLVGWVFRDEGGWLLCQLPVLSRLESEPAAGTVLKATLVEFVAASEGPSEEVAVVGDNGLREMLTKSDIRFIDDPDDAEVVMMRADPTNGLSSAQLGALDEALDDEKTVFVLGVTDKMNGWLSRCGVRAVVGKPYAILPQEPARERQRGRNESVPWFCRLDNAGLFAGVVNDDLFWLPTPSMFHWGMSAYRARQPQRAKLSRKGMIEQPMDGAHAVLKPTSSSSKAVFRTEPSVIAEVPVGKGRLVLSTARFAENFGRAPEKIARVLRSFLNNAGARTSRPQPIRDYSFADIRASFNRALWNDPLNQKPDGAFDPVGWFGDARNDMRYFPVNLCGWSVSANNMCPREAWPTEPMRLGPVNFKLQLEDGKRTGSKGCIVLDKGDVVRIDLKGDKVHGFWFLGCSGGYHRNAELSLRVNGKGDPLVFEQNKDFNMFRWAGDLTTGKLAWTGCTPLDRTASLYAFRGDNPRPDEPVEFLELSCTSKPCVYNNVTNYASVAVIAITLEK